MKRFAWMVMILLSVVSVASALDNISGEIQLRGQTCANAMVNHDIDHVLQYTHPVVIRMSGGTQGFIAAFEHATRDMADQGLAFAFAEVDKPTTIKHINHTTYAVLPQVITMTAPGGMLISTGHLLAVSPDKDGKWYFADMAPLNNDNIGMVFPDLLNKIDVPEKTEPTFIPFDFYDMNSTKTQSRPL